MKIYVESASETIKSTTWKKKSHREGFAERRLLEAI